MFQEGSGTLRQGDEAKSIQVKRNAVKRGVSKEDKEMPRIRLKRRLAH